MIALALDHVWQSTLFVAGAGFVVLFLKANSASLRYRIWFLASLKFLFPLALLTEAGRGVSHLLAAAPVEAPIAVTLASAAQPFSEGTSFSTPAVASWNWNIILGAFWLAGFVATLVAWAHQWRQLQKLVQSAVPFKSGAPLPVRASTSQMEPALVGIFAPVLILPAGIADRLSPAELDAIIAHETCHWRRRDNLTAALHMMVETIFWFHPLVWWLESRLIAERERACDEDVLAAGRDPEVYAEGILKICKSYVQTPMQCASGVSGADLKMRIEAIMESRLAVRLNLLKRSLLAACASAVVAAPIVIGLLTAPPVIVPAFAQAHPGTEAVLRRLIDGLEEGHVEYALMIPAIAQQQRPGGESLLASVRKWGALKSITFRGNKNGNDVYLVAFSNQAIYWTLGPLNPDGRIAPPLRFDPVIARDGNRPLPGLQAAIRRDLEGAFAGRPAYEIMTPGHRATTDSQWAALRAIALELGAVRSIALESVDARGWDIYHVTFANGAVTVEAAPLRDNKLDQAYITSILLPNAPAHKDREALVRQFIEGSLKETYPFDRMSPALGALVLQQQGRIREQNAKAGDLKSIVFAGGGTVGIDVYTVVCAHATFEYRFGPLTPDGKLDGLRRSVLT